MAKKPRFPKQAGASKESQPASAFATDGFDWSTFAFDTQKSMRRSQDSSPASEEPFDVRTLDNGRKVAELKNGYGWGTAATATFILRHRTILQREIGLARNVYLCARTDDTQPTDPDIAVVLAEYPDLRNLATKEQIRDFLTRPNSLTAREAAIDVLHSVFPGYSRDYISRRSRESTYNYRPKTARTHRKRTP